MATQPVVRVGPNLVHRNGVESVGIVYLTEALHYQRVLLNGFDMSVAMLLENRHTFSPLIAATPARRDAIQYAANLLGDFAEGPEDAKHLAVLDEMLAEMKGGADEPAP